MPCSPGRGRRPDDPHLSSLSPQMCPSPGRGRRPDDPPFLPLRASALLHMVQSCRKTDKPPAFHPQTAGKAKICPDLLTTAGSGAILQSNRIHQTVDAEITAIMPSQRACDAENQAGNKLSNGPPRAQSNVGPHRVFCDATGRRDMPGICRYPDQAHGQTVNQGGTADKYLFALDRDVFSVGAFLFCKIL